MTLKLHTIVASTRPGRVGPSIAKWFNEFAAEHGKFDPVLVDLADFNLPVYDEPEHPRLRNYHHAHTKAWSESVSEADAFVFVTPEYNYGPPPSLLNALNYLALEWNYTPAGFVSYGGISGGLRAVQVTKQILTTFKVMPVPEGVPMPMVFPHLENGVLKPAEIYKTSAATMLDELHA
jgi:NAD(P)H-dependent FMN reductase